MVGRAPGRSVSSDERGGLTVSGNLPPLVYADRLAREMAAFALAAGTATEDGELTLARAFENAEGDRPERCAHPDGALIEPDPRDRTALCSAAHGGCGRRVPVDGGSLAHGADSEVSMPSTVQEVSHA